jgi:hypothetical protein
MSTTRLSTLLLFALASSLLGSCAGGGSSRIPFAQLQPGDPIEISFFSRGANRPNSELVILDRSQYDALMETREGQQRLPQTVSRHKDADMVRLVQDFATIGYFNGAGTFAAPPTASFLSIRAQGSTYVLVHPLQGGRVTEDPDLWAKSLQLFQLAYNAGERMRGEVRSGQLDLDAEKRRIERANAEAEAKQREIMRERLRGRR